MNIYELLLCSLKNYFQTFPMIDTPPTPVYLQI